MDEVWVNSGMPLSVNQRLTAVVTEQRHRLGAFVRRQVNDASDAEDIVQEVFAELFEAYRLMQPIERVGAWLVRVARNRIIDRFRARARESMPIESPIAAAGQEDADSDLPELLAAAGTGPEAEYRRELLGEAIERALDELPAEQRAVFVAHELEGKSFKQLSQETGLGMNTLLGRKHAAVLHLRRTLRALYEDLQ
ncbi:MAG: RNA polymerase sigma factor [Steroidobacteraceae bacterium]